MREETYRALQLHLDEQTVGFPAAESGADIRLLEQLFPPEQAEMAMLLTYRYEPLEQIQARARQQGKSVEAVERILEETARRGVIGRTVKDGVKHYRNIPYVVGMAEAAAFNPSIEFLNAALAYHVDGSFWNAFLNSAVPQMRTIPIEQSITPERHVGRYDQIEGIIECTDDPIAIVECVCRKGAGSRGSPCQQTSRKETCMVLRDGAKHILENGGGREISKQEALAILRQNGEDGLVLQPSNAQGPDFICSCCGCCCGILALHKSVENPVSHWATNFYAALDAELCSGCRMCEDTCQANALEFNDDEMIPCFDLTRCLGCGNCEVACPDEAIELRRRETEVVPPLTGEDMTEVIMAAKA
jgi:formate hydrogenlyase subunit 6/NADH:ubiquinone oxidoreductase subunit I